MESIKNIHIYTHRSGALNVGLEIVKSLSLECLTQEIKPTIFMHTVSGEWPADMFAYAFGFLMVQGVQLSFTNCIVEDGMTFGKKIYVVYLKV